MWTELKFYLCSGKFSFKGRMREKGGEMWEAWAGSDKWKFIKSGKRGVWLIWSPSGFANWCLLKLGSSPPTEMGRQGPYLHVLARIQKFFWQPWSIRKYDSVCSNLLIVWGGGWNHWSWESAVFIFIFYYFLRSSQKRAQEEPD